MRLTLNRSSFFLCVSIFILVTFSRGINLGFESLWHDERGSLFLSKLNWLSIIENKYDFFHPQLFSLLLKAWTIIIGEITEAKLRALSFLFNNLSALTIFLILKNKCNKLYAALGAVSFLCLGSVFRYSAEIRPYALGAFLLIQFFYWYFIKDKKLLAFVFYLMALQTQYLLYLYFFIILTFDIFRLRKLSLFHISSLLCACGFFLLYVLRSELGQGPYWDYSHWSYHFGAISYFFLNTFNFWHENENVYSIFIYLLSFAFIGSIIVNAMSWRQKLSDDILVVLLSLTPVLLFAILPLNLVLERFYYFSNPFIAISIGLAAGRTKEDFRKGITFCYLLTLLAFSHYYWSGNYFKYKKKPEWRESTNYLFEKKDILKRKLYYISPYPIMEPETFDYYIDKIKNYYSLEIILFEDLEKNFDNKEKDFLFVIVDKENESIEILKKKFFSQYEFNLVQGWRRLKIYSASRNSN
ncbi:MAG: hypothetical protein K9K67_03900 [Bacteriovoracaceae bacterium]|nr:hypothetical protein [Bacteriovoracaceae bacterium]